jgi:methylmalonyl-CoA/ethylmalonyl-CoA epimerase
VADLNFDIQEIVLAVNDADAAASRLASVFATEPDKLATFEQPGIEIVMGGVWVGSCHVSLVQDESGRGHVSRFLEKRGEGLFEICLRTSDIRAAMEHMKANGIRFTSDEPEVLRDYPWRDEVYSEVHVAFVRPDSAFGVQIELQQWFK